MQPAAKSVVSKIQPVGGTGSYKSLVKSTSLLGGATAFNVLLGMGRVKCVALLLGPAGLGMMGAYQSIITVTTSLTGMGLAYSGVREVAEARGSGDERRLWDTVATFRQLSRWLGVIGMVGLAAMAWPVSQLTFKSGEHWVAIVVLASVVWCSLLSSYHMAIIQSAQEIGRLARLNMISGLIGTAVSLTCFAVWGQEGVVPALAAGGIVQWSLAWYFARGLRESQLPASAAYSPAIAGRLFKFGGIMLALAVMSALVAFAQRVMVLRQMDESALGLMQAAEALSGLYAGYILGAMGTDFLPRLSAATGDRETLNRLVNEQTVVALLLGTPGVVGTICFASVVIPLFYAASFEPAVGVLQWMAVGVYGRLVSWPLGYLLLALGDMRTVWLNALSMMTQLVTIWIALPMFGVMAAGLASIAMHVMHTATNWQVAHRLTGFRWSREACEVMAFGGVAVMVAAAITHYLPKYWDVVASVVLLGAMGFFSYRRLVRLTGIAFVDRIRSRLAQAES